MNFKKGVSKVIQMINYELNEVKKG